MLGVSLYLFLISLYSILAPLYLFYLSFGAVLAPFYSILLKVLEEAVVLNN